MLSVKQKILIARVLNRVLGFGRRLAGLGMYSRCRRRNVNWELDLNEGIDLCIYLLGAYEPRTLRAYASLVRPGNIVFDIGANIGAHTLHFARLVGPTGHIYAFEPTDYACAKLRRNLALNSSLVQRVSVMQIFLVGDHAENPPSTVPSSWPVGNGRDDPHEVHFGKAQALTRAIAMTADSFCLTAGIERIDFVKIDVDGCEYPILRGFRESLSRFRPALLIEIAPYVYQGANFAEFDEFIHFLVDLGYDFTDSNTRRTIPRDPVALRRAITPGAGINALLRFSPAK
jgi:FkbM family methyltransferase